MIDPIARLSRTDPSHLGPYRLYGVLGSGSAGTVYLGRGAPRRGARKQPAAVRAVRPELLRDRQLRARVRQESTRVADAVSSPFVAGALGCELDSEQPWIASTFAPGHSLATLVAHFGPLPEMSVRALGGALARALTALHTAGVAHRDLRAANVLLTAEGPRLVDYGTGLGRPAAGPPPGGALAGGFGGLARAADDVFELGALLVLAASARQPFAGSPLPAARETPDLTDVPDALHTPLLSCLHKTPEARPSPEALARALDLSAAANRPATEWLPDSYLHEIGSRADEARSLAGRRLFGW
ncbi:protein kinase domain-containing protein [Streptomyces axinellae]|uniref:Protein kinase domain-containing protein n=1 Tax=Streptomyces axinellae TaxID=552788 RepID=A0ABN3PYR2_9ACTN